MKLENQVISLELAKKLKELGVQQDSELVWGIGGDKCEKEWTLLFNNDESWSAETIYSAFTVAELGKKLMEKGIQDFPFVEYYSHAEEDCWKFKNPFTKYKENILVFESVDKMSEADCRANALIYLLENN
jgi:hypothetical protein